MITSPFHRCHRVNCLVHNVKERYNLNNAKVFEYSEPRGNGDRTKRTRYQKFCPRESAYGNLEMDNG